jgi:hypothetical protein
MFGRHASGTNLHFVLATQARRLQVIKGEVTVKAITLRAQEADRRDYADFGTVFRAHQPDEIKVVIEWDGAKGEESYSE